MSVVVPTYNRAHLIVDALESISGQTYRPIEIVVVDDGSTDDSQRTVERWTAEHCEHRRLTLKYVAQANEGANAARNRGVAEAKGAYVAFLDSDDRWLPEKLAKQMPLFQSNREVGGVYCGLRYVNLVTGEAAPTAERSFPSGRILDRLLVHDVTEGTPCWIIRRSCLEEIGGFDKSLPARQDWDMWIRLAAKYAIAVVPEILVIAGDHPGERVRTSAQRELDAHRSIFDKYASLRSQFPISVRLGARSAMYRRRGRVYFHRGISTPKAILMELMAIVTWPFNFDSYAALLGMMMPKGLRRKTHILWNRAFGKTALAIKAH